MRRDFGNEIVVAISAVAIVAFALAFAILLAISSRGNEPASQNVADSNIGMETLGSETTLDILSTSTKSLPPTTLSPATQTNTARAVTATSDATSTPRQRLATPTPTLVSTNTVVPTVVEALSDPPSPTNQPSATFTVTPSLTPSRTSSPTPSSTATLTPTFSATPTATESPTMTPTAEPCARPQGWVDYVVQDGDTLFALAQAIPYPLAELRDVNCLQTSLGLAFGQVVFVPRLPSEPVATTVPAILSQRRVLAQGCENGRAQIVVPLTFQQVTGLVDIVGTADDSQLAFYKIEVRPDAINNYEQYLVATDPVYNGVLGTLNTHLFDNGLHWIRLALYDDTSRELAYCAVPVFFTD